MSRFPEISSLFAALASNLHAQEPVARNELDLSIANLNRSLNLSETSRVRILDTALSLMCFTAPQFYNSVIEFTVKSIVAVLSSSIECQLLKINKDQTLRVGGLISKSDCANVMGMCADILGKFDGHKGDLCGLLLYNVIRVAALAPCIQPAMPSISNLEMKFNNSSTCALANLVGHFPNEFTFKNGEIPLRLLLWHLDPMMLKQDLSQILQDIIKRPFLSLSAEIYNRIEWRSKIICLVISPAMFVETRTLLHKWFLMTGLASVMELQIEFIGQVLDIISRPMWWGISMEVGLKLPFSHAYFPYEHHLLRILAGPISPEYFQHLLQKISGSISQTKIKAVDHKSMWAMVVNFPGWLFFASMLLFCDSSPTGAAKFIAWVLNPMCESSQYLTVDFLVKVSDLWTLKSCSNKDDEVIRVHEEGRRPILHDKDGITSKELDSSAVFIWLKEFKDMYIKLFKTGGFSTSNTKGFSVHQNLLLRRIPLGILLVRPNLLNLAGCSLLLHYSATGSIQKLSHLQNSGQTQKRWKNDRQEDSLTWIGQYTKAEAIAGCRTVLDITDIAESISPCIYENEEEGLNFICQLKLKSGDYLLKCIKRLLQIKIDGDGCQMKRDLLSKVIRWKRQGKDVFQNNKNMDYVCDALDV